MFTVIYSNCSGHMTGTQRRQRSGVPIEFLEARVLFAFNAYIAGPASGEVNVDTTFTFSTTGEAAKAWLIDWGDGTTTPLTASDPNAGFTTPQTAQHHYNRADNFPISAVATSVTNATANAVFALNSAWTGEGSGGGAGKTVDALPDGSNVSTSVCATVVDDDGLAYVLSVDGKRMAVSRFTTTGQLDTTWATGGTYVLQPFTLSTVQDTPRAMTIDAANHLLYVAGGSNNKWAISRINIDSIATTPQAWSASILTGTATGLWLDRTDGNETIGVAGTSAGNEIQVAVLYAVDVGTPFFPRRSTPAAPSPTSRTARATPPRPTRFTPSTRRTPCGPRRRRSSSATTSRIRARTRSGSSPAR